MIDYKAVLALGVVIGGGYFLLKSEATKAAVFVGESVDITSDQNLVYKSVNAIGESLTGDAHFSLGGWMYDQFN